MVKRKESSMCVAGGVAASRETSRSGREGREPPIADAGYACTSD